MENNVWYIKIQNVILKQAAPLNGEGYIYIHTHTYVYI